MKAHAIALGFVVGCSHAPSAPEPTGPLAVQVTRAGIAVPDAQVVFGDADGAIVATAMTDGSGAAATDLAAWQVTVIDPDKPTRLVTVAHARSGAPITIPLISDAAPTLPTIGMLTVQPPPGAPPAGTFQYMIHTGCGGRGGTTLPITMAIDATCLGDDGNVPVVIEARTQDNGLEHPGDVLAISAGLATASNTGFALAAPAWSTGCTSVDVANPSSMQLSLWQRYDGREIRGIDASFCHVMPSPGFDYAYPLVPLDPGFTTTTYTNLGTANIWGLRTTDFPTRPLSIAAEQNDLLLGDITLGTVGVDGARWTASHELLAADLVMAKLTYVLADHSFVEWRLVEPGWADRADLPDLPVSLALGTTTENLAEVHYLDASWLTSNLTDAQRDLPVILGATTEGIRLPSGATVREYAHDFYP